MFYLKDKIDQMKKDSEKEQIEKPTKRHIIYKVSK